jgi:hypothetical protein
MSESHVTGDAAQDTAAGARYATGRAASSCAKEQGSEPMKKNLLALAMALGVFVSQEASAQSASGGLAGMIGAPFSGVRSQQAARNFVDGNRIDSGRSVHLYRDAQGRTRVERDVDTAFGAPDPRMQFSPIVINDPVSGEVIELQPQSKTAIVIKGVAPHAIPVPADVPPIAVSFARRFYGANDPGWSKPVSLGDKMLNGVRATGTQRQYTIAAGSVGNEKPIVLTVEQWYSPELGLIVMKNARASTGGEFAFQVENIVRGDPDAALFTIPPGYKVVETGRRAAAQ